MSDLAEKELYKSVEILLEELKITNYKIDSKPGTVKGDNYFSVITNVIVSGLDNDNNQKDLNLIIKSSQQNEEYRQEIDQAFEREAYMYTEFFPLLINFQKEKCITQPLTSFAKFYKPSLEGINKFLIMENMKAIGYELRDRQKILDYNHTSLIMREYGKLHALSFALRDQKPKVFQELVDKCQEQLFTNYHDDELMINFQITCDKAMESLDQELDGPVILKFQNFRNNVWDIILKTVSHEAAEPHSVLAHGDCWVNNILFKYDNTDEPYVPTKSCLLDWQLAHAGSPVLDLSYFIFTCTDKEFRDKYYDALIDEYYNSFSTFLRELGSDPDKLFPFEIFQKHLKKFSYYGLMMSLFVVKLMLTETEEAHDFSKMNREERLNSSKEDFKNSDKYQVRARGIILDFYRLNYL